mmetsp:Transcript_36113/g.81478  ORF Transcript_36113/g.81478 Transcript_36113/m.81478 type:complete len:213 (+) Transcript_36113:344-982(+)
MIRKTRMQGGSPNTISSGSCKGGNGRLPTKPMLFETSATLTMPYRHSRPSKPGAVMPGRLRPRLLARLKMRGGGRSRQFEGLRSIRRFCVSACGTIVPSCTRDSPWRKKKRRLEQGEACEAYRHVASGELLTSSAPGLGKTARNQARHCVPRMRFQGAHSLTAWDEFVSHPDRKDYVGRVRIVGRYPPKPLPTQQQFDASCRSVAEPFLELG